MCTCDLFDYREHDFGKDENITIEMKFSEQVISMFIVSVINALGATKVRLITYCIV